MMNHKFYRILAAAAVMALGLAGNLFAVQAASADSADDWGLQMLRRMDKMERQMDSDMAAQRRFFSQWMDHSMTMPDPFAQAWRDGSFDMDKLQSLTALQPKTAPSSEVQLTGADGSSVMKLSTWSSNAPANTDIHYAVSNQTLDGNVTADKNSSLNLALRDKTYFKGALNGDQKAKAVTVSLDKDAVWDVTGTSYVTSLSDANPSLKNIHSNGNNIYYDAKDSGSAWLKGETKTLPGGGKLMPQA
ncbi:hypothetical protein [uncultured Megasphaera sp.]|uniref:hypothetical protein n=1 Tax=uncultured Megasphaera sp. TaxID=165188 RepID=UPI0028688E63|nr:hypothetical protein [uncultured Megasphaera sp.]